MGVDVRVCVWGVPSPLSGQNRPCSHVWGLNEVGGPEERPSNRSEMQHWPPLRAGAIHCDFWVP